ncbi:MAG: SCO family protein [Candidatus Eisenbacteria bacterium]|uniref:SCO family protein n=1 Tax=Eiseniibacteriota bacterium TaxID=2212470 RepID=A0A937X6P6_UNCEI|nr:SCO family protein [Candidatus Eisenbacteria bacterium]
MLPALVGALLFFAAPSGAQPAGGDSTAGAMPSPSPVALAPSSATTEVGVDEHLGLALPLDLAFHDETGRPVPLREIIDRPTILTLVYYRCPGICSPLLSGLVDTLDRLDLVPGTDYEVLTISFDPSETPDLAARKRANHLAAFSKPFPAPAWTCMTGDSASIAALTDAVGFRYQRAGKDFTHPGVLTILTPDGRIARYLYGISFLPFDLKLALVEAARGKTGPSINRLLYYCFSYDPDGQKYVFSIVKVAGVVILFFAAIFVLYLVVTGRRARRGDA